MVPFGLKIHSSPSTRSNISAVAQPQAVVLGAGVAGLRSRACVTQGTRADDSNDRALKYMNLLITIFACGKTGTAHKRSEPQAGLRRAYHLKPTRGPEGGKGKGRVGRRELPQATPQSNGSELS